MQKGKRQHPNAGSHPIIDLAPCEILSEKFLILEKNIRNFVKQILQGVKLHLELRMMQKLVKQRKYVVQNGKNAIFP